MEKRRFRYQVPAYYGAEQTLGYVLDHLEKNDVAGAVKLAHGYFVQKDKQEQVDRALQEFRQALADGGVE